MNPGPPSVMQQLRPSRDRTECRHGPGLVVSVKNRREAVDAMHAGAHVVDVKDPSRGALGCADPELIADVAAALSGTVPVSAAAGEMAAWSNRGDALRRWFSIARGMMLAKFGTAGLRSHSKWCQLRDLVRNRCPNQVCLVAVVYADWRSAGALQPSVVIDGAAEMGCELVLIDTCGKAKGDLFTVWPRGELVAAVDRVRRHQMGLVLGGSITLDSLDTAVRLQPDFIAVRGAVCEGGRRADLSGQRVGQFVAHLDHTVRHLDSDAAVSPPQPFGQPVVPRWDRRVWGGGEPPNR